MRILLAVLAFSTTVFSTLAHAAPDKTGEIIRQVTQAAGGQTAARAIPALLYQLHIKEATFEVDANYFVDRRGRMRVDVYAGDKRVFTECYDGKKAWEMDGDGTAKEASASGRAALWHGTQYPGQILDLSELPAHGHKVAFVGTEKVGGVDFDVLQLTMSDGFVTFRYVDPETHWIVRGRDFRAPHPDIDSKKITVETIWSDWRAVDGVMRPFKSVQSDLASGQWQQTATVKSIRRLPALPDSLFKFGSSSETSWPIAPDS
jgi:hypothetical protein